MLDIQRVDAEQIMAQRFDDVATRSLLQPDTVLVVEGLIGDASILAGCSEWIRTFCHQAEEVPSSFQVDLKEELARPTPLRQVLKLQRVLMLALTDQTPKWYVAQVNSNPVGTRVGKHKDGRFNLNVATVASGGGAFQFIEKGQTKEVELEPDVTVFMYNGARGIKHATRNHSNERRNLVVQRGYLVQ